MEIMRKASIATLSNSGAQSEQLLFPENSSSRRVTITRVTMQPGAVNPPHRHANSEQIWVALEGRGTLLLEGDRTEPFAVGDVDAARTATSTVFATPPMGCSFICRSRRRRLTSARHTPRAGANPLSRIPPSRMSTRLGPLAPMTPRLRGIRLRAVGVVAGTLPEPTRRRLPQLATSFISYQARNVAYWPLAPDHVLRG